MSSPTGSMSETDFIEDASLNKKRGRAQSQEPTALVKEDEQVEEKSASVSAPKKTKRDEESSTVSTIRKNMKDMTTTDKVSESTATSESHDDDEQMGAIDEEEDEELLDQPTTTTTEPEAAPTTTSTSTTAQSLAQFGGNSKNDDDWGEFAQDDEEETVQKPKEDLNKSKYTFGASSGFGTKGWAASHQTIPTPSKQPTFGSGFGTSSAFGGFKSATTSTASPFAINSDSNKSIPSFSSFAKATTSPFAAAAAAAATTTTTTGNNALSSSASVTSPSTTENDKESDNENDDDNGNDNNGGNSGGEGVADTPSSATFGESAKVKVPGVKETKVTTGEENEDTIYQTKGKLFVLDSTQNWKERGVGTFRLNMSEEGGDKPEYRLVMRTDSVYRLILNLKLFPGMKVLMMQEKYVTFGALQVDEETKETKFVKYALKLSSAITAKEVHQHITSCIPPADNSES